MRLQAKVEFLYRTVMIMPNDLFDAPEEQGLWLVDREYAVPYNLEDPSKRAAGVFVSTMPDVPPVTLSPTSATSPGVGGASSFTVTMTGPGLSGTWTVDKDVAWITIVSPTTPQSVSGPVNYSVDALTPPPASRVGRIYVNGKTFTVTQS
jgi:hypothetical protein